MKPADKLGIALFILLIITFIIPRVSALARQSDMRIMGFSLNDFLLILITIIVLIWIILTFVHKKFDFSPSKKRFKRAYKPKSDLDRLRLYIGDQVKAGKTPSHIKQVLRKVGWHDEIIDNAFSTYTRVKLVVFKPKRRKIKN